MVEIISTNRFRIRLFRIIRVSLLILLCSCAIPAQYRIDQWTADNGLPQNSVYDVLQTQEGYLWLATVDGLVRFDGVNFTVFNKSNTPGIVNNRFISLFEDGNGDLWAGTEESGIIRLHNGTFSSYGIAEGLNALEIYSITRDEQDAVVIISRDFKMVRFDGEKFVPYEPAPESEKSTAETKVKKIGCGLSPFAKELGCLLRGRLVRINSIEPTPISNVHTKVIKDKNDSLWIRFPKSGLLRYDPDGKMIVLKEGEGLPGMPLVLIPRDDGFSLLSKDKDGAVWLTDMNGMRSELVTRHPPDSFFDFAWAPEGTFTSAYQDPEGSIWLGTIRSGLFRLRRQTVKTYSKDEGLSENNVYPIYQDRHGRTWVGTTNGLFKYENDTFELIRGSEGFSLNALGETSDGRLLISVYQPTSTLGNRVDVLENDQFKPFYYVQSFYGLTTAIFTDDDGTTWMGGPFGLVKHKDGVSTLFTEQNGLAGNDVKSIIRDGAGGMWIGSYGGLTHYRDGKFTKWAQAEGLRSLTVRTLYLDSEGVIWIGSYDGGISRFKDGKFTYYDTKIGLFNDGAFQMLEDDRRNFWISSNRGIYRVRKDELNEFAEGKRSSINSISYGKSDGLLNVECNGGRMPGGIRARDGRLWFPTQGGVAVIDPKDVKTNPKPPPVVIESVKIDNKSVSSFSGKELPQIQLEPTQQNFEIQYTALSFINSENIRFRYKLEGLDTDWIEAGTRRTAYFSHVAPGDYTFRVIAANADGIWNESGESVRITILPPFYRTWWFLIVSAAAIAVIAYVFYKRRILQVERQRLLQQNFSRQLIASQEAERKRIAGELHDGLGQRLVVIKNLIWMVLNAKGKYDEGQLREVSDEASQAISEVKTISYNLRPYQLDRMGLTRALEGIIRSAETASEIEFTTEIDNINDYFPKEMEINFYRIVQESVNNILKHSGATNAVIAIKREANTIDVVISDNGRGFSTDDNSANPKSKIQNPKSSGFGLIGIRERIELLGGKMEIKSAPNEGTSVIIKLERDRERD